MNNKGQTLVRRYIMNNKGQTLILFVLLLPIIFIIFSLIIDLGLLHIDKRSIENNLYDAVEYYLTSDDINKKEKVKEVLKNNLNDIDIFIDDTSDYVLIKVTKERNSAFSKIFNLNKVTISYKGLKNTNKIIKG